MNNIFKMKYFSILFLAILLVQGCESDFLEQRPSTSVTQDDVFKSPESARSVLTAIYRDWRSFVQANQAGLHDLGIVADCKGPDLIASKSWFTNEVAYASFTQTSGVVWYPWWMFYRNINNINDLLENIDKLSGTQEAIDDVKGEALAMRAYCYFELIKRYQHTYSIASGMPGIPIYTEATTAETLGNPRAPVSDVYTQIITDLTQAEDLMDNERMNKGYFNLDVVNAILARVYLTMEDWGNAITYAQAARQDYPLMSAEEWQSGFMDVGNSEWIWGQNNNADENPSWGSAVNALDPDAAEYPVYSSKTLAGLYSATDIRGELFLEDIEGRDWNYKFEMGDPRYSNDYPLIRSAEMYLIEAEAMAKSPSPDESGAQDALYEVQHRADPNAVKSTNTGQDLIDEIILEKRKEFWGEGIYFFDMLRNEMPLVRDADHVAPLGFPANSWEFIFPIPEQEFLINKNLDMATDQNPVTGVYSGK